MKYYLITYPQEMSITPYSYGVIDEYNPAPKGSKKFKTKRQLDSAITKIDDFKKSKLPKYDKKKIDKVFKEIEKEG